MARAIRCLRTGVLNPAEPVGLAIADAAALGVVEGAAGVVAPIQLRGKAELADVADAVGALRGGFGASECGQQHRRQNRDDGDDDEQFNQGEGTFAGFRCAARGVRCGWRRKTFFHLKYFHAALADAGAITEIFRHAREEGVRHLHWHAPARA